jgi:capsular polysaccharide biosynthesis protein
MGGHYGHFITEGLSTFWVFEKHAAKEFDYFVFHPFTFGVEIPPYARSCLEHFGIPLEKVVFVGEERLGFSELVVPERLFRLNHSADVRSSWTYQNIAAAAPVPRSAPDRIYLSRRKFSRRQFERVVANKVEIENVFRAYGFEIVYPETLAFLEQVSLCNCATTIAGISGSGLHNSVFMKSGTLLIELGDPRYGGRPAPTQALCNHIAGAFIPFAGAMFGPKNTMLFHVSTLGMALTSILGPPQTALRVGFPHGLKHSVEIAYLASRPAVGFWARRFIRRRRNG